MLISSIYAGAKAGDLLEPGLPVLTTSHGVRGYFWYAKASGSSWGDYVKSNEFVSTTGSAYYSTITKSNFNDVRPLSISISRFIKLF